MFFSFNEKKAEMDQEAEGNVALTRAEALLREVESSSAIHLVCNVQYYMNNTGEPKW